MRRKTMLIYAIFAEIKGVIRCCHNPCQGQFYNIYSPNILQANNHTLSQIDFTTSIDPEEASRVTKVDDITNRAENIAQYDKICLSEYCWGNVSLVFTIDDTLPNKTLILIYDSDPGWDDEKDVLSPYVPEKEIILT